MTTSATVDPLWPSLGVPGDIGASATVDLASIEATPIGDRGLPASTYRVLVRRAGLTPDRAAVTFLAAGEHYEQPVTWTFAQLLTRVRQAANAFTALGIGRGDAVAVLSSNSSQVLTTLLAAQAVGVVAPINPALAPDRVEALLRTGAARLLVAAGPELDPEIWSTAVRLGRDLGLDAVLAVRPDAPGGVHPAPRPDLEPVDGLRVAYLEDLASRQPDHELLAAEPAGSDLAAYFHTGGTTGAPKLAAHTHGNEVAMAWSLAVSRSIPDDAVILAGLPLFHVNALLVTVLTPLMHGQQVVWTGPLGYRDPTLYQHFWRIIERYRVAAMSAVPTVYAVLAEIPVDADISSLEAAACGAAPLSGAVRDGFEQHTGVALIEGYGLTEATCASARTLPGHYRPGSVGQRMPYQQIKAVRVDPDTGGWTDLPPGERGLLVIAGPTVFPGYLQPGPDGPVVTAGDRVRDGWLDTGDLGTVDDDGYVFLAGREKDLIIRGGHNIDPATVEDALLEHPDVTGAAAVGRPDPHAGEVPVAYVTVRAGSSVTGEDLRDWVRPLITERGSAPRFVHVVDDIPLTLVGKPFKPALRQDSIRRVVEAELAELGLDGTVTVRLETAHGKPSADVEGVASADRDAVRDRLRRYTFEHTFPTRP